MKVVIAGGSGFIGKHLTDFLVKEGHEVVILTRSNKMSNKDVSYVVWLKDGAFPEKELKNVDAVINLAGVSINDGRWTKEHQARIYQSRMTATDELLRIVAALPEKPAVWINASAIGIYPTSLDAIYTEEFQVISNDFLGKTVNDWEQKAKQAEQFGIRTAFMRFGVVLGKDGGAFPLMALPYQLFVGGTIGSGEQWVSWIHIFDVVRAIGFVMNHSHLQGPINVTAPSPVKMKDFGKTIGEVLKRPHWLPVPSYAMKLALGQKSKLVLEGQKVLPKVLLEAEFSFLYPTLDIALKDLFQKAKLKGGKR